MQFPEPYRRKNSKIYCFKYTDPLTLTRKRKSTEKDTKREADEFIAEFMRNLEKGYTDKTFSEYAEPYFIAESCPHVLRKSNENKNIGMKHIHHSRRWLELHVFTDKEFSILKMTEIKRKHILALRERIRKKVGESVVNQTMNAVKVIISEAFYHEDIDRNPGSGIGVLKYDKQEKGILSLQEIQMLFKDRPGFWASNLSYDVFF